MINIKLEKENTVFVNPFEQISVKPIILTVVLISSLITILSVKKINEVPSNNPMLASRVTQCAQTIYHGGRVRSTRRYFWRSDCPTGWHQV